MIRSATTQTASFTTDKGSLQQWRSTQGAWRIALQKLQNRISQIIRNRITLDMDALNRSCSAEAAVGFELVGSLDAVIKGKKLDRPAPLNKPATRNRPSPLAFTLAQCRRPSVHQAPAGAQIHRSSRKRTRRHRRRSRRSSDRLGKRECSDTIEDSSFSDDTVVWKKRPRSHREFGYSRMAHLQSHICHLFHVISHSIHTSCSSVLWHGASFTVASCPLAQQRLKPRSTLAPCSA